MSDTTIIEIIDTAVKIGLGALISGIATYWITHSKNSFELRKLRLEDQRETLREVALMIDEAIDLLNDFVHFYTHEGNSIAVKDQNDYLISSHKKAGCTAHYLTNQRGQTRLILNKDAPRRIG